jgi:hypothetical protein
VTPNGPLTLVPLLAPLALAGACASDQAAERGDPPAAAVVGDALDTSPAELATEVVHLDGLDARLEGLSRIGRLLTQSFVGAVLRDANAPDTGPSPAAQAWLQRVEKAAARVYVPDDMRRAVEAHVAEAAGSEAHLTAVLAHFHSELARKVAERRARVRTPIGAKQMSDWLISTGGRELSELRLERVKGLLEARAEDQLLATLSFGASASAIEVLAPSLPEELRGGFAGWKEQQAAQMEGFLAKVGRTLALQDAFALRDLSDDELVEVLGFWTSDAGRWYAQVRLEAAQALVAARAKALGDEMASGDES